MKKLASILLLALLAPAVLPAQGEPARAECRWTPGLYALGEPAVLEVRLPVDGPDYFLTGLPGPGTEWAEGRVVKSAQEKPATYPGTLTLSLTLQLFGVGEVTLPPILVSVNTARGAVAFLVEPPPLAIRASLPEGAPAPDPAQVLAYPDPGPWAWLLPVLGLLAVLAAGGVWLLKRMRQPGTLPRPPQVADPDAWIRGEVARLLAGGVDPAFRYGALSKCLREYLEIKTGLPFPDWTTHEIRGHVDRVPRLDGDPARALVLLLSLCDQVKFARYAPSPEEERAVRPAVDGLLAALRRPEPPARGEAA